MSQIGGLLFLDEGIGSRENVSTLEILELVVGVGKMLVRWKYWSWWYSVSRGITSSSIVSNSAHYKKNCYPLCYLYANFCFSIGDFSTWR